MVGTHEYLSFLPPSQCGLRIVPSFSKVLIPLSSSLLNDKRVPRGPRAKEDQKKSREKDVTQTYDSKLD